MPDTLDNERFRLLLRTLPGKAIDYLYTHYYEGLVRLSGKYLRDRHLAEDIVQEAFAVGLDRLRTLNDGAAVRAWLAAKAARLNRAEAMARMGLSMHHTQQAMRLLASTRPVDGLTAREWLLSPEDVDAAAAMYRAARGGR